MSARPRQIDSTIDVVTPENISFQYEVAGPFRRLPAFLIDLAVRFAAWAFFLILLTFLNLGTNVGDELLIALWLLSWFLLEWFYGGVLEAYWNGQTFGKRALGLRVLSIDGQPINGLQAVMRNLLRLADMMPLIPLGIGTAGESSIMLPTCLIGLVTPLLNTRYQRLGDLVCGTMVVVESSQRRGQVVQLDEPGIEQLAEDLPADFVVSRKMSQALATYVERRRYLPPGRRHDIARHVAAPLSRAWNLPASLSADQLLCALYYRHFVRRAEQAFESPDPEYPGAAPSGGAPPDVPLDAVPVAAISTDARSPDASVEPIVATLVEES